MWLYPPALTDHYSMYMDGVFDDGESTGAYLLGGGTGGAVTAVSVLPLSVWHRFGAKVTPTGIALHVNGAETPTIQRADTTHSSLVALGIHATSSDTDDVAVSADSILSCSALPDGYKLRVGGASGRVGAGAVGGIATVECAGLCFPLEVNTLPATVEVLDAADVVKAVFTAANDVWGGDTFNYSEG
jgi:hypothetical protein